MTHSFHRLVIPGKSKPYLIAHRGNQVACPENTLAAFRRALTDGADMIETDLHLSRDGVFVCIHDETVDRTTDGQGPVADKTLAELKQLSAAYHRPEFKNERIPMLAETLALIPPGVGIVLELKTDRFLEHCVCQQLVRELDQADRRSCAVAISFSLKRALAVRAVAPDIPIGFITMGNPLPLQDVQLLGPFWPLLLLNGLYVPLAHARGRLVCPLDPRPDSRLGFYRLLKCDAILSNDPGATRRRLNRKF